MYKEDKLKPIGNPHTWKFIQFAGCRDEGWMKSTRAMEAGQGVIVKTMTHIWDINGTCRTSESLVYVPNVKIVDDPEHDSSKLVGI